jgi:hypothetical protein
LNEWIGLKGWRDKGIKEDEGGMEMDQLMKG